VSASRLHIKVLVKYKFVTINFFHFLRYQLLTSTICSLSSTTCYVTWFITLAPIFSDLCPLELTIFLNIFLMLSLYFFKDQFHTQNTLKHLLFARCLFSLIFASFLSREFIFLANISLCLYTCPKMNTIRKCVQMDIYLRESIVTSCSYSSVAAYTYRTDN
jgi:hypothetical protein